MDESTQETPSAQKQPEPQEVRTPITARDALKRRMSVVQFKIEPFDFDMDGDLMRVDGHELTGGERVELLDLARKLHEGKLDGGTRRFIREVLARVYREHGTGLAIWNAKDDKDKALIDGLPRDAQDALLNNALKLNGMDPDALKNAKNASEKDA